MPATTNEDRKVARYTTADSHIHAQRSTSSHVRSAVTVNSLHFADTGNN